MPTQSPQRTASLDFETYSEAGYIYDAVAAKWRNVKRSGRAGIEAVGTFAYAEHPTTEVLCAAYDLHDGAGLRLWTPGCPPPVELFDPDLLIVAWNSMFEWSIWNNVCVRRYGWPELSLDRMRDTAAAARRYSLPASLGAAGAALRVEALKQTDGARLIKLFSVPRSPTKKDPRLRVHPHEAPADAAKLYDYCVHDVIAEAAIGAAVPPLSDLERRVWMLDQQINARGVHVDLDAMDAMQRRVDTIRAELVPELVRVTGGAVNSGSEVAKMIAYIGARGVQARDLDEGTVGDLLTRADLPADVRRVLELRQALALASVNKLAALRLRVSRDGRLRGAFMYCGADRTGRWSGKGVQLQNLPRCTDRVEDSFAAVMRGGGGLSEVSESLRLLFTAAPGRDLICSDYSAIEAVVLAAIAGEEWRLEVFRTHGMIYEMSVAKITGIPFEEIAECKARTGKHHALRNSVGKVAELASGFRGWIDAWKRFGAASHFANDADIKTAILKWRAASPAIVELWGGQWRQVGPFVFVAERYGLEGAAVNAVENPGVWYTYRSISYALNPATGVLHCRLPSGRDLHYHNAALVDDRDRFSGKPIKQIVFTSPDKTGRAVVMRTHGGVLTENVVQAASRDILAEAMLRVDAAGYPIVMHVHDEIVAEVDPGFGSVAELEAIMQQRPTWAADWPIRAAGGWRGKRYRK